jgi:hypothetical protein
MVLQSEDEKSHIKRNDAVLLTCFGKNFGAKRPCIQNWNVKSEHRIARLTVSISQSEISSSAKGSSMLVSYVGSCSDKRQLVATLAL